MAATALVVTTMPLFGQIAALAFTTVDNVNGNSIPGDGKTMLVLRGLAGGGHIATMTSVADENGRTGDIVTAAIAEDEIMVLYPSRGDVFKQKTGDDKGKVVFSYDGANIQQVAVQYKL